MENENDQKSGCGTNSHEVYYWCYHYIEFVTPVIPVFFYITPSFPYGN